MLKFCILVYYGSVWWAWYGMILWGWYGMVWYSMLCDMRWHGMVCLCGMVWSSMIGYAVAQYVTLWHAVLCGTLKRKLHGARRRVRLLVQPSQVMTA